MILSRLLFQRSIKLSSHFSFSTSSSTPTPHHHPADPENLYLLFHDLDLLSHPASSSSNSPFVPRWLTASQLLDARVQPSSLPSPAPHGSGDLLVPSIHVQLSPTRFALGLHDGAHSTRHDSLQIQDLYNPLPPRNAVSHRFPDASFVPLLKLLGASPSPVSQEDALLLSKARALVYFHQTHRFCGCCGAPSLPSPSLVDSQTADPHTSEPIGKSRRCSNESCKRQWFPRVEPACIMLVVDAEKDCCLLGRNHNRPPGRYSVLAGFVDTGEGLESAVAREVMEEAGVSVDMASFRYLDSQFFPYPHSLMLGCSVRATSSRITIQEKEMADVQWVSRARVAHMLEHPDAPPNMHLPQAGTIAHRILSHFAQGKFMY